MLRDIRGESLCLLLAGGQGSRLKPLTTDRAKPSVPFGGKYRIIDFTLSNCLHSDIRRVLVLTQYKSHSLQKHLRDAWSVFNPELGEYITAVPPQMRTGDSWYSGTADAIYQNLYLVERSSAEYVLILSADHIYRMDYAAMLERHKQTGADLSIGCMHVPLTYASSFGIVTVDQRDRIIEFEEKPASPAAIPGNKDHALASMGIYIFNRETLSKALHEDHANTSSSHDFGNDIIPSLIQSLNVYGYQFGSKDGRVTQDRYWRDVGTIDSYYDANLDLLSPKPPLNLYQQSWPIRTYQGQYPPARVVTGSCQTQANIRDSILCSGTMVLDASISKSILSPNVKIEHGASVESSILFDGVRVGQGAKLRRCIIDKHVSIPAGTTIGFDQKNDERRFTISNNGIVVVPKSFNA